MIHPVQLLDGGDEGAVSNALTTGDRLLTSLVGGREIDDRFANSPAQVAVLPNEAGAVIGVATISPAPRPVGSPLPPWSIQFVIDPDYNGHLTQLIASLVPAAGAELWIRPDDADLARPLSEGWPDATENRRLHLMAVDLPVEVEPIPSRALDPASEADVAAIVRVNNAAFAAHPDQSGMTVDDVFAKLASPGHSPDGVRLAEIDGTINGFCWTQLHPERFVGEISVIGLHPDVHGRGLGAPMTSAGLDWIHSQGVATAILYVEASNRAAVSSYLRLGFRIVHDDVSWIIPGESTRD